MFYLLLWRECKHLLRQAQGVWPVAKRKLVVKFCVEEYPRRSAIETIERRASASSRFAHSMRHAFLNASGGSPVSSLKLRTRWLGERFVRATRSSSVNAVAGSARISATTLDSLSDAVWSGEAAAASMTANSRSRTPPLKRSCRQRVPRSSASYMRNSR